MLLLPLAEILLLMFRVYELDDLAVMSVGFCDDLGFGAEGD